MPSRLLALAALSFAIGAEASIVVVANAPTQVRLRIGSTGNTVNLVTFTVPAGNVGDSTVVTSTVSGGATGGTCPANHVFFDAEGRANPANSRTITLSADGSLFPLTNGSNTIPWTDISWVTNATSFAPVTIPSGTFTGGPGQVMASWLNSRRNRGCLQFQYSNASVYQAGTYNGRVRFTVAMP